MADPRRVEFGGKVQEFPSDATDAEIQSALGTTTTPPTWFEQHPKTAAVAKATLSALPAIGGIVGGALSTPETFGAGTVPGIALGAGAGRGLQDLITEGIGLEPKSSPLAKAGRIGVDTAIAGGTAGAMKLGSSVIEAAAENPTRTLGEFLKNILSPRQTGMRVAKELMAHEPNAGAILQRPAWQTWSGPPVNAPTIPAADVLKIQNLMKQGLSSVDAYKAVLAAKSGVR